MSHIYKQLVSSGANQRFKRDILLDTADDIVSPFHIRNLFDKEVQGQAAECAKRLIGELLTKGYCELVRWNGERDAFEVIRLSEEELRSLIEQNRDYGVWLRGTSKCDEWLARYRELLAEL